MEPPDTTESTRPTRGPRIWPWLLVLLLGAGGAGVWYVLQHPRGPAEAPVVADAGTTSMDAGPRASIEEGDALLHELGAGWSKDPLYAKWLAALVLRQLVAATQLVADGDSPRPSLPFLAIQGPFAVREQPVAAPPPKGRQKKKAPSPPPRLFIDPASYARYDELTAVFGSIDAAAAGDAWGRLRPYCEAAFSEIGRPGARFDDVLAAAIGRVAGVALVEGELELEPRGAVYAFKDPALEALSAAEKHLLRMGPKNARVVQAQLRTFASHAGLDAGRDAGRSLDGTREPGRAARY